MEFKYYSIVLFIFISSASFGQAAQTSESWMPFTLEAGTTTLFLEDYFFRATDVDAVSAPPWLKVRLDKQKRTVQIEPLHADSPPISILSFKCGNETYSLVLFKSKQERVHFAFDPEGVAYQSVSIAGDINGWNPEKTPLVFQNGLWQTDLDLLPGRYQYLMVLDSMWMLDPQNPKQVPNGLGGINSLMVIGEKDRTKSPFYYLQEMLDDKVVIGTENHQTLDPVFILWNNELIPYKEGSSISFIIPQEANAMPVSYLRLFGYSQEGSGNDVLIPLTFGQVETNPANIDRHDFHTSIMYFLLVDRFMNGDKNNDAPIDDIRVDPKANYMGGDLAGVQQKLNEGYFENMGFNTLWLSPVFQNPRQAYQEYPEPHRWFSGYHGYWPISLSQIDDRFGSNEQYKALVDSLHEEDMNMVLDYIANHVHSEHPLWTEHPDWFTNLQLPDGRQNIRLWDEQRLSTWFEPYMPSLDHSQTVVARASADSAMWWLTEYNIDGFRHDATKHIETEFWRMLTRSIRFESAGNTGYPVYQIGETFGSRELIGSYLGTGLLDAQFDFNLFFDARNILAGDSTSFVDLSASLHNSFDYYGYHHLMGNISGNHDLARFISYAGKSISWQENDKEAGWNRDIQVEDLVGYKKLELLHAFNMTIPGIPIVYYGDEIGMPGAGDPDNRRMMRFDDLSQEEQQVKVSVRQLAKMRAQHMALLYGDFQELYVTDDVWVYSRQYLDDQVIVCLNKGDAPALVELDLPEQLQSLMQRVGSQQGQQQQNGQQGGQQQEGTENPSKELLSVTIPAYSYRIIVSK